jgi:hypothetical protein
MIASSSTISTFPSRESLMRKPGAEVEVKVKVEVEVEAEG